MSEFEHDDTTPDLTPAAEPAAWEGTPEFDTAVEHRVDEMLDEYLAADPAAYAPDDAQGFQPVDVGNQGDAMRAMLDARDEHLYGVMNQALGPLVEFSQAANQFEQQRQELAAEDATVEAVLNAIGDDFNHAGAKALAAEQFDSWAQTHGQSATPEQFKQAATEALQEAAKRVASESETDAVARYIRNREQNTGLYRPDPAPANDDATETAVVQRLFGEHSYT